VLCVTAWCAVAAANVDSGPKAGERVPAFPVDNVTGQAVQGLALDARDELCYR
jgi:hypothetical protein